MADIAPAARGSLALVADRTFGPFFAGSLVVSCAVFFQNIAAAVIVFRITGSAVLVGTVSVLQFASPLVLSPWTGSLSDRVDRRRMLIAASAIAASGGTGLAVWIGLAGVEGLPGPWPILGAAFLLGLGYAFAVPSSQALVPALVPRADLAQAVGLHSLTFNVGRAIGPAAGAATLVAFGPASAFAVGAAGWVLFFGALLTIRPREVERSPSAPSSALEGFRHVRRDRRTLLLLLGVTAVGFGVDPAITLTPALAAGFGGGDRLVGFMASAFGFGAIASIALVRPIRQRLGVGWLGTAGLFALGGGMLVVAGSPTAAWAIAGFTIGGAGLLLANTSLITQIQERVPEDLRGRVMALWGMAYLGSRPVAALLHGSVADLVSVPAAAAVAGGIVLLTALGVPPEAPEPADGSRA